MMHYIFFIAVRLDVSFVLCRTPCVPVCVYVLVRARVMVATKLIQLN